MDENVTKIAAPIYLLRSSEPCWKCGAVQQVIALATMHLVENDPEDNVENGDEPIILNNIAEMPKEILNHICSLHPQYEKRTSKMAGSAHYMNTCSCGAHFGDFYLHSEPGGAFFPNSEEQARQITVQELPFTGTFEFLCGYGIGTGSFIFEHAQRR
jgi:hypothetical protein